MTPLQQNPSAQAPCTKATFGRSLISFSALLVLRSSRGARSEPRSRAPGDPTYRSSRHTTNASLACCDSFNRYERQYRLDARHTRRLPDPKYAERRFWRACSVDTASTGHRQLDLRLRCGSVTIDCCSKTGVGANVDRVIEVRWVCISATAATVEFVVRAWRLRRRRHRTARDASAGPEQAFTVHERHHPRTHCGRRLERESDHE